MATRPRARAGPASVPAFDAQAFLDSSGVEKAVVRYARGETVFSQGDVAGHVLYIQTGGIKLSVLSKSGREAVVAMLGPGDFFGDSTRCPTGSSRTC
jgi:CRP/FNR family cyclic AMP-dependent transcriptional regulator